MRNGTFNARPRCLFLGGHQRLIVIGAAVLASGFFCALEARDPFPVGPSAAARETGRSIVTAGQPAELDVRTSGPNSLRVTLKPITFKDEFPANPAVSSRLYPSPGLIVRDLGAPVRKVVGRFEVEVRPEPLTVTVRRAGGQLVQEIVFEPDGSLSFPLGESPVLGLGEGGPRPVRGLPWREQPVQFDRRGALDEMEPRWQSDMYGSRNPAPMLLGTSGWGLFVAAPWVRVDLRKGDRGVCLPWKPPAAGAPQTEGNQQQNLGKGLPPADAIIPGLYDLFVFDARDPAGALGDFAAITGRAAMPPKWALGYMQSHRTIENDAQLLEIIDTFRAKRLPLDAVIYLGTGFCPRGWNTKQPSFEFNPDVFRRDPKAVLADMHARHVKVVVHVVPWDRNRLPTLHGSIPARPGETVDESHLKAYWQQHLGLVNAGVDAFWPDEGDWFNLFERIERHKLYYQGPLSTGADVRPWSLQRNGYPGIAQWGGWVWSGDTESSWKTLEAQIAVGLNYSLSIGPYWGSDIGGFYANSELTGELYARWHQFAAFCGSFRSHGRTWWTRLPWGWGGSDIGPRENDNRNAPIPPGDPRNILPSELNNPAIEPVVKKYSELRYQLMPYTYTLAWEAREKGLPLMRALWVHYPDDERARGIGDEFLWGRDLLVAPVFTKGAAARQVYLPRGDWYDWWTNSRLAGGQTITRAVDLATMPIYVRAGAIIPIDPVRQYTGQAVEEPTTLRVYRGADGQYTLYEDDGISQDYLKGKGTWTRITWNDGARRLTIEPGAPGGATNVVVRRRFRILLVPDGAARDVTYSGSRVGVAF
ncbi:MAG TPA: TIM-barrel domain-containing protein [Vicinamibacterales bacterium]|jgi:alpha-glucosidase/alpha-D-xyloside xylohydrolase